MKNYHAPADGVQLTAPYAVTPGDGMLVGSLFAVASKTAASGVLTDAVTEGMFYLPTVSAETAPEGSTAFWDAVNRRVSVSTGVAIGHFSYAKLAGETSTRVRLQASALAVQTSALVSGAGNFGPKSSMMFLGDSLTFQGAGNKHPLAQGVALKTISAIPSIGASGFIRQAYFAATCPTGNGNLRWYAASQSLTWQAFGDTEGAPVTQAAWGYVRLNSGTPGNEMYLLCSPASSRPATDQTDVVSVSATNASSAGVNRSFHSGFTGAWELLTGHPFADVYNFGIAGASTTNVLAYKDQWNSVTTDVTVVHLGTNDIISSGSIAGAVTAFENLKLIVGERKATGSIVIVGLLFGGNAANFPANSYRALTHYNNLVRDWCLTNKIPCFDGAQYLLDPYSTTGDARANVFRDGLHLTGAGALLVAKYALDPVLAPYCPEKQPRIASGLYDAALAPGGNLLANGQLAGTGGTLNTGVTGTVPTGFNLGRMGSTATMVCTAPQAGSPIARTDGKPGAWCRIAASSVGTADSFVFQSAVVTGANYAAGDKVVLTGEWRYSGSGIQTISAAIVSNLGSSVVGSDFSTSVNMGDLAGETVLASFETEPLTLLPGVNSLRATITVALLSGGTITLDIAPTLTLRKV